MIDVPSCSLHTMKFNPYKMLFSEIGSHNTRYIYLTTQTYEPFKD